MKTFVMFLGIVLFAVPAVAQFTTRASLHGEYDGGFGIGGINDPGQQHAIQVDSILHQDAGLGVMVERFHAHTWAGPVFRFSAGDFGLFGGVLLNLRERGATDQLVLGIDREIGGGGCSSGPGSETPR